MFKSRRRQDKTIVGLEIDPSHIAAAEVHVNGGISVKRGAVASLRPGVLRDGEVADAAALTAELKELFAAHDLPSRVRIGIANQRIVVRAIDLPIADDPKALDALVQAQAPDHIPMPMGEAILDYQVQGVVSTPEGPRTRVTIVAVRREMIERIVAAARDAGLQVAGIDLSAFAMVRALGTTEGDEGVLYVSIAGLTNVAVATERGCHFTRAAAGGLDEMVHTLAERRGLTSEHARQWMHHVGLVAPLEELQGDPDLVAATRHALEEGVHQLADTVRNSLNFYRTLENAETVAHGLLTGPAVAIPGFAERLSEQLKLPIEPAAVAAAHDAAELDAGRLTVAAGLAVDDVS